MYILPTYLGALCNFFKFSDLSTLCQYSYLCYDYVVVNALCLRFLSKHKKWPSRITMWNSSRISG